MSSRYISNIAYSVKLSLHSSRLFSLLCSHPFEALPPLWWTVTSALVAEIFSVWIGRSGNLKSYRTCRRAGRSLLVSISLWVLFLVGVQTSLVTSFVLFGGFTFFCSYSPSMTGWRANRLGMEDVSLEQCACWLLWLDSSCISASVVSGSLLTPSLHDLQITDVKAARYSTDILRSFCMYIGC